MFVTRVASMRSFKSIVFFPFVDVIWHVAVAPAVFTFELRHSFVSPFVEQRTTLYEIFLSHLPQTLILMKHMFEMVIVITVHAQLATPPRF